MRIGIYPGTFDPLHEGHFAFAKKAISDGFVDHVVFLPERTPRSKSSVTPIAERIKQMRAATEDAPDLSIRQLAVDQFDVASTLPILLDQYPADTLYLLCGSDVALHLRQWQDLDTLIESMGILVGMRSTESPAQVERVLGPILPHVQFIETDQQHVSSSMYRKRKNST